MKDLETAAREWWIEQGIRGASSGTKYPDTVLSEKPSSTGFIHVIEHSAYAKALKRIEELEKEVRRYVHQWQEAAIDWGKERSILKAQLTKEREISKLLEEALRFYAGRENWMRSWVTNSNDIAPSKWADKLKVQDCAMLNCGGGRARLAIAEVQKLRGVSEPLDK